MKSITVTVPDEVYRMAGCTTVLSEDLGDAVDYGGVRIEDPFRDA